MTLLKLIERIIVESLANVALLTSLAAMLSAQIIKVIYYRIVEGRFKWIHMFEAGGMPSSHSALVCSLSMIVGLKSGFDSILFAAVVLFSSVVMYDAIKVRAEEVGHTLIEVGLGGILGIIIALLSYLLYC
jgi:acid phosphatase family membrane protein YuiD